MNIFSLPKTFKSFMVVFMTTLLERLATNLSRVLSLTSPNDGLVDEVFLLRNASSPLRFTWTFYLFFSFSSFNFY